MEQEEIWRDIEGYEGLYQVSNFGRVKSVDRIGGRGRRLKGRILSPRMAKNGYLQVDLCKEGKEKTLKVHRLVAQAFIPNEEGLPEINHRDEDKTNNLADNLEWCDRFYNMRYGTRTERQVQTMISKGTFDPELCGIRTKDRNEYFRMYKHKNREKIREQQRDYYRRRRKNKITA